MSNLLFMQHLCSKRRHSISYNEPPYKRVLIFLEIPVAFNLVCITSDRGSLPIKSHLHTDNASLIKYKVSSLKWLKIDCSWLPTSRDKRLKQCKGFGILKGVETMNQFLHLITPPNNLNVAVQMHQISF